jgi:2,4-dienoyl-CoA reductase-like NADH-dependent reductase (Old Yellow Enzyme family)
VRLSDDRSNLTVAANEEGMTEFFRVNNPIQIGSIELHNPLVFAPMVTNLANPDGTVSNALIEFVRARAQGGVGLVITENTVVNPAGRLFPNTRIDGDEFIPGLAQLFAAVHQEGAKVIIQLDHEGRETIPDATNGLGPVAPSPIPSPTFQVAPREMTTSDIEQTISDFVAAALRAQKAGADGVELQGAHGFLIHQFLSPCTNKRTDAYGGNVESRTRFVVEIIKKIKKSAGNDFVVCCRISGEDFVAGGLTLKDTMPIAKLLEKAGADAIHVSAGVLETADHIAPPQTFPGIPHAYLSAAIRKTITIPVIAAGKVSGLDVAEKLIIEGKADLVAFARPLLADPELVNKELAGLSEEVTRCVWCNSCFEKILSPEPAIACKLHNG